MVPRQYAWNTPESSGVVTKCSLVEYRGTDYHGLGYVIGTIVKVHLAVHYVTAYRIDTLPLYVLEDVLQHMEDLGWH